MWRRNLLVFAIDANYHQNPTQSRPTFHLEYPLGLLQQIPYFRLESEIGKISEMGNKLGLLRNKWKIEKKLKMESWKKSSTEKSEKRQKKNDFGGASEKHSLLMVETTDCWISISD